MCYVISEVALFVGEYWLPDLLIVLLVQGISDVFAYPSLESLNNCPISPLKIILGFPSTDLRCYACCYTRWMCAGGLNRLDVVEAQFC